jgi:hypothetical protein
LSRGLILGIIGENEDGMMREMAGRKRVIWLHLMAAALFLSVLTSPAGAGLVQEFKGQYDPIIKTCSRRYNVPADLIHSIIKTESNYDSWAVSPKGAAGLMQLMPETAAQYGVNDRFDPEDNIKGGVKYLKDLCRLYSNNTKLVLAAYNAGQEALKKFSGIPPYPETREYIKRVMASYPKSYITGGTPIRRFVNASGQYVFTNDPYYHLNSRKNRD